MNDLKNDLNSVSVNNLTEQKIPDIIQKDMQKDMPKKRGRKSKKSTLERLEEVKAKRRRSPLFSQKQFNIKKEPGYHYRVVSDDEYEYCVNRGYEPDPNYKQLSFQAGRSKDPSQIGSARVSLGGEKYGTVMRIHQELFDEDQLEKLEMDKKRQKALLQPIEDSRDKRQSTDKLEIKTINYEDL